MPPPPKGAVPERGSQASVELKVLALGSLIPCLSFRTAAQIDEKPPSELTTIS